MRLSGKRAALFTGDDALELVERRESAECLCRAVVHQTPHAVCHRSLPQLRVGRTIEREPAKLVVHHHELMHADLAAVASIAERASNRGEEEVLAVVEAELGAFDLGDGPTAPAIDT